MNIKRDCFYGNNDCNCNVSESSHVDYLVQISRETRSDNVHEETHINTNGQRKEENRKKKRNERNNRAVSPHIQVCKHACVIIIESAMKSEFPPETPLLICVSVFQSDLCQEVNAAGA